MKEPPETLVQFPRGLNLIPALGSFPGGGNGNPLQYSCLENSMNRGAWGAIQSMASQCQTWLRRHASHMNKYWAKLFMSPYTPELTHKSSTRSKIFQTLTLSLAIFFFFTFDLQKVNWWDPNRSLIASNIRMVQGGWYTDRFVDWKFVGLVSPALKLEWPASYQQSYLSKVTFSKIALVTTYWSS